MNYIILIPIVVAWIVSIYILIYMKNKTDRKTEEEIYNVERAALNYAEECLILSFIIAIAPSVTLWLILNILEKETLVSLAAYIVFVFFTFRTTVKFKYGSNAFQG